MEYIGLLIIIVFNIFNHLLHISVYIFFSKFQRCVIVWFILGI